MSRPSTSTAPRSGSISAAIRLSSVVLPDPLGPYSATSSPAPTDSDTPSTARTGSSSPPWSVLTRSRSSSIGGPSKGRAPWTLAREVDDVPPLGLRRRGRRQQPAARERGRPVRAARQVGVAGADQHGTPPLPRERAQQPRYPLGLLHVERRGQIVYEQQPRLARDRVRERDQCALPEIGRASCRGRGQIAGGDLS